MTYVDVRVYHKGERERDNRLLRNFLSSSIVEGVLVYGKRMRRNLKQFFVIF